MKIYDYITLNTNSILFLLEIYIDGENIKNSSIIDE